MTRRFRLRPMVREIEGEDIWAGVLPHGPILRLGGAAAPLLAVLAEKGEALDSADVTAHLRAEIVGMPEDAEQVIAEFLDQLADLGLVEIVEVAATDASDARGDTIEPDTSDSCESEIP